MILLAVLLLVPGCDRDKVAKLERTLAIEKLPDAKLLSLVSESFMQLESRGFSNFVVYSSGAFIVQKNDRLNLVMPMEALVGTNGVIELEAMAPEIEPETKRSYGLKRHGVEL